VVLREFIETGSLLLAIGDASCEDASRGEDDYGVALQLPRQPLAQAEEEGFVDEEAYTVGQLVACLALVAPVAEINHRQHIVISNHASSFIVRRPTLSMIGSLLACLPRRLPPPSSLLLLRLWDVLSRSEKLLCENGVVSLGPIYSLQLHIHEVPDVFPEFLLDLCVEVLVLHPCDLAGEGEEGDPAGQVQTFATALDRVVPDTESSPREVQSSNVHFLFPLDPAVPVLNGEGSQTGSSSVLPCVVGLEGESSRDIQFLLLDPQGNVPTVLEFAKFPVFVLSISPKE
jgi:hypothetical protein